MKTEWTDRDDEMLDEWSNTLVETSARLNLALWNARRELRKTWLGRVVYRIFRRWL